VKTPLKRKKMSRLNSRANIVKSEKGHDVFIDNEFILWVTGSRRQATKELELHLKKYSIIL
jgi:hypothetical protein